MNIDINDDSPEEEKGKKSLWEEIWQRVGFRFIDTELESLIIHFSSFINPPKKFGFLRFLSI